MRNSRTLEVDRDVIIWYKKVESRILNTTFQNDSLNGHLHRFSSTEDKGNVDVTDK